MVEYLICFIGAWTLSGVFERYLELNGIKTIEGEGGSYEVSIIDPHIWA